MSSEKSGTLTDQRVVDTIRESNPKTVEELVKLLQQEYPISEQKILEHLLRLKEQRKIVLEKHSARSPSLLKNYIFSTKAKWYWTTIAVAAVTASLVLTVPENAYPIAFARHLLGAIFVLLLPGYSFIKALFPTRELDKIERTALSVGMSLALVSITGLLLNYTPLGIKTAPVTLSLLALTISFATVAIIRER